MIILDNIRQTDWWTKATKYKDRHYDASSGVMLSDHLNSVAASIDKIFSDTESPFIIDLFSLFNVLNLDKEKVRQELLMVSLLHDIGKTEDDKTQKMEHPLKKELVFKRHPVIGVQAAIEVLSSETSLSDTDKSKIYALIDEHDTPYGLFRQFEKTSVIPEFKSWKKLNNKIDDKDGVGLLYLLIFKLADIDGHESVQDVIWFFTAAQEKYFNQLGLQLPIPNESDVR
jgi:hypothetical protein